KSADGLRLPGIHAGKAMGWPRLRVLPPVHGRIAMPLHETTSPRGGRKPKCWYRPRSRAPISIDDIANLIPARASEFGLMPLALKARSAEFERRTAARIRDDLVQSALYQSP